MDREEGEALCGYCALFLSQSLSFLLLLLAALLLLFLGLLPLLEDLFKLIFDIFRHHVRQLHPPDGLVELDRLEKLLGG